jgi:hypothetical protein
MIPDLVGIVHREPGHVSCLPRLYANTAGPMLLFRRRYVFFILLSFLFFLVILTFLFAVYSLVLKFPLSALKNFISLYNKRTITRECLWCVLNMSLAIAIFFIRKALDEKDLLHRGSA